MSAAAAATSLALTPATIGLALAAGGLAGMLRGFTGFGFALAAVPALTLAFDPADVVPSILLLQIVASVQLLPTTHHLIDWRSLAPLLAGAAIGTPVGTAILAEAAPDAMRAVIGLVLLAAVAALARRPSLHRDPPLAARLGIGLVSGLLNGGTAMSGPPVIVYFLATAATVEVGRASLLMYFLLISIAGAISAAFAGLVAPRTLALAALMFPALVAGNALGDRWFDRTSPERYRRVALAVLAAIAVVAIARAAAR